MPISISADQLKLIQHPVVWSPADGRHVSPGETQDSVSNALAGLLLAVSTPEAALRLFLKETEVEQVSEPPKGYNPIQQGEWDPLGINFHFKRPIRLMRLEKTPNLLTVEYNFGDLGYWTVTIEADSVRIARV